jgi:colicin import membrane protein
LSDRDYADTGGLLRTGFVSFLLHITLVVALILSTRSTIPKIGPSVYRVTIRPFSPQGDGTPLGSPNPGPGRTVELPASPPGEKLKPVVNQKGTEKVEAAKSRQKKAENAEKAWSLEKRKSSLRSLEEAMEDIDKKAALEEIKKKIARRERSARVSQELTASGGGTGTGSGTGSGPSGSPSGGSPWGSSSGGSYSGRFSALEEEYKGVIYAKIKKQWTSPRDLQGRTDLKTTISFTLDKEGRIQKMNIEKSSGNALFDQSVKRALKKSEPLPPIPKELNEDTVEITFDIEQ